MSSLIEQAALRLEQLRQAGVMVPDMPTAPVAPLPSAALAAQRLQHAVNGRDAAPPLTPTPQTSTAPQPSSPSQSQRIDLDFDALAAANIVTPTAPRSLVADQFRVVKRPLIANAMGKGAATPAHANLIMVTSAVAGEGKSFTSVNLAISIAAELDNTVMLVDADVARPSLPRMLGVPEGPGLLDLLDGAADMADVLLKTNIDKLTLLRSGTPHARATEMLASEAMRQLLHDMSTRYPDRIIIFDSPPLLLTTEARALATNMGQIVVVVHAGKTLQANVQRALSTLEACPLKMMVLNQTRADAQEASELGYGYGYGYGGVKHGA